MPSVVWLVVAVVCGGAAYLVGWPAWTAYRAREARDTNRERYLAWRGRAVRRHSGTPGMSGAERQRIYAGAALAVVGVVALLAFFGSS